MDYLTLSYGKGRKKSYITIEIPTWKIWVDMNVLPTSAFLCAGCDGISMLSQKCGKERKFRYFLPIDWLIEEWGGPKEIVNELKIIKEKRTQEKEELLRWSKENEKKDYGS